MTTDLAPSLFSSVWLCGCMLCREEEQLRGIAGRAAVHKCKLFSLTSVTGYLAATAACPL